MEVEQLVTRATIASATRLPFLFLRAPDFHEQLPGGAFRRAVPSLAIRTDERKPRNVLGGDPFHATGVFRMTTPCVGSELGRARPGHSFSAPLLIPDCAEDYRRHRKHDDQDDRPIHVPSP